MSVSMLPPDGGYGWIIVFAMALNNFAINPLCQNFGLLYKDAFEDMGLTGTQGSLIININAAFGLLAAFFNGPLLKMFGYRKMAVVSTILIGTGVILTSFATTFYVFIITYGIILSLGITISASAYHLAIMSYFTNNRGKALGVAMTLTGVGSIAMPQIVIALIKWYSNREVTFLLGGLALHGLISALLLHPVRWYMRKIEPEEETAISKQTEVSEEYTHTSNNLRTNQNLENGAWYDEDYGAPPTYEEFAGLCSADNYGGSVYSLHSISKYRVAMDESFKNKNKYDQLRNNNVFSKYYSKDLMQQREKKRKNFIKKRHSMWKKAVRLFGLDILKDPVYVNIMLGMSLSLFVESNFSNFTAFILGDLGLTAPQIATFMSVLGTSDLICRGLAPIVGDYCNVPPRLMFTFTLILFILFRSLLLVYHKYVYFIAVGLGIAKGIRMVYIGLIIPSHVPLEKVPSATGIQMLCNGILTLSLGSTLGVVRDKTGNYNMCVVLLNCITAISLVLWFLEYILKRNNKRLPDGGLKQRDCDES